MGRRGRVGYLVLKVVFAEVSGFGGPPVSVRQRSLRGETDRVLLLKVQLTPPSEYSSCACPVLRLPSLTRTHAPKTLLNLDLTMH